MNSNHTFHTLAVTALLAAAMILTHAESWEELLPSDDFALATSGYGNILLDPLSDDLANPGLFVGHSRGSGAVSIYRLTPSDPESWSYNVEPVDNGLETVRRLGYCPNDGTLSGTFYAVGSSTESRAIVWKVRKSEAGGRPNTWIDDGPSFNLKKGATSIATGVTADTSGNAYACGRAFDGRTPHWIVRRKTPRDSWITVLDVKGTGDTTANGICFLPTKGQNPADAVFVVGNLTGKWTVLRSHNQGASGTWQFVDSWSPDSRTSAAATDVACDSAGNIYVVGYRGVWESPKGWVVRMGSHGGDPGSWTTVLDASEGTASWASALTVDGGDNLWISGMTLNASGIPRWTVLRHNPSQSWEDSWTARQRPFGDTTSSKGRGIAADTFGNVFAAGELGPDLGLLRLVPSQAAP
jgi:hypothetical protein